jgi:hypothetical protein
MSKGREISDITVPVSRFRAQVLRHHLRVMHASKSCTTPPDHCVRFAPAVADDCATLASRRRATTLPGPVFHRQERVSFA